MIKIDNLNKRFKRNEVLKGLSLDFDRPGITALLGPNGSGKTTLVKCLLGMVIPDKGQILFNGKDITGKHEYRNQISYLPQIARFPENLTVRELLKLMMNIRVDAHRKAQLLDLFGLEQELDKKMSTLSGGTRQKLNLTLAFMYDSPLIMLDEPSTGLDPLALLSLKEFLKNEKSRGKSILLITHILGLVEELADQVIFILDGKIHYHGGILELIEQEEKPNLETAIANILR